MAEQTGIQWTDHTFNPWWGCTRISPGCAHCYAAKDAERFGFNLWDKEGQRRFFGDKHWQEPLKWNRQAQDAQVPHRVFCASMADVFEDHPNLNDPRKRLWELIESTPCLDWQLLTKRPENMQFPFTPSDWDANGWPPNVWAMTSVENQELAKRRLPDLLRVNAITRGLSVEPILGPIDLSPWINHWEGKIHWIIVGGESGHGARHCQLEWIRAIVSQCKQAGVACFVKQLGSNPSSLNSRLKHSKGGDMNEWPEDFKIRQFPGDN